MGGINQSGAVTGCYFDINGNLGSFVRTAQGKATLFDAPDAVYGTQAASINPSGAITGYYYDANFNRHGFVRAKNGKITTFDPQISTGTVVTGMNAGGMVTGTYRDAHGIHGFVFQSGAD